MYIAAKKNVSINFISTVRLQNIFFLSTATTAGHLTYKRKKLQLLKLTKYFIKLIIDLVEFK